MEECKEVYSQVLGVLLALGDKYMQKIPKNMMLYLKKNSDYNSIPQIDRNKSIEEQNISEDARAFLIMLKLKYWCESEEEKKEVIRTLKDNEKAYQEELKKKYNYDTLFEDKKNNDNVDFNPKLLMKVKKTNFFRRIIDKIKNLFNL